MSNSALAQQMVVRQAPPKIVSSLVLSLLFQSCEIIASLHDSYSFKAVVPALLKLQDCLISKLLSHLSQNYRIALFQSCEVTFSKATGLPLSKAVKSPFSRPNDYHFSKMCDERLCVDHFVLSRWIIFVCEQDDVQKCYVWPTRRTSFSESFSCPEENSWVRRPEMMKTRFDRFLLLPGLQYPVVRAR